MKYRKALHILACCISAFLIGSCTADEPNRLNWSESDGAVFMASIAPHEDPLAPTSRAMRALGDDQWSYVRFDSPSDIIGFFSTQGNVANGGNAPFLNEPMAWTRSTGSGDENTRWRGIFSGENMDYDVGLIQQEGTKIFVYFPYAEGAMKKGLLLRQEAPDGSIRCVDALQIQNFINNNEPTMSGTFQHAFSEIMFTRGNGFDNPPPGKERITVVMSEGYSHARIDDYTGTNHPEYWKVFIPVYNEDCGMTEEQCRRWEAWKGAPYKPNEFTDPLDAYYCILPTGLSVLNTSVEYIEVYDNLGELHKITSFYLRGENNKSLNPTHQYKLNIVMEGLVPTIYPYSIEPWEEPENITDARNSGINDPGQFIEFLSAYNSYIEKIDNNRDTSTEETQLAKFGNKYTTDGKVGWHFYLNQSFNVSATFDANFKIVNLRDTIDGMRNTLSGLKINDDSGFIGELSEGGCLMNLNVSGLTVNNEAPTGGLTNLISGGLIQNCNIDGNITAQGYQVGMAAMQMTGGTIRGCSFTGLLAGSSTFRNIFAIQPTNGLWENNNNSFTGIIFTEY